MKESDLFELVSAIVERKVETSTLELKAARDGSPLRIFDTLSSFSNTSGGVIIFGIDEKNGFEVCGVHDRNLLEKKIVEESDRMIPPVRPEITFCDYEGKAVVAAEIHEMDVSEKPCHYGPYGIMKGSFTRVGEADKLMSEYEVYSYQAFRYKKEDELRTKDRIGMDLIDERRIDEYIGKALDMKPNMASLDRETLLEICGIKAGGLPTICGLLLFGKMPQVISPNLDIIAVANAGKEYGASDIAGERFSDSTRLDGTIPVMLSSALSFVKRNMKSSVVVDEDGKRRDVPQYPIRAVREVVLNALVHRDYSIYTENDPVRIEMYEDRLVVSNPGGLYGRLTLDSLGKVRKDVRNPFLVSILELMGEAENRYTGIPTIYKEMQNAGLPEPLFENRDGCFSVTLYNTRKEIIADSDIAGRIVAFCRKPRSKETLAEEFGFDHRRPTYFFNNYVLPLIEKGLLTYTIPEKPKSKYQRIVAL